MDAQSIADLLSRSTTQLTDLYAQLGHPPDTLQAALTELHDSVRVSVEGQISSIQRQVTETIAQCEQLCHDISSIRTALGESENTDLKAKVEAQPLSPRFELLLLEKQRLDTEYQSRAEQTDKLQAELDAFRPALGDFVQMPLLETPLGVQAAAPSSVASSSTSSSPASSPSLRPLPLSHITALSAAISRCSAELTSRQERLQCHLVEILQLWSELHIAPAMKDTEFDAQVCSTLGVIPTLTAADGDPAIMIFEGLFDPVDTSVPAPASALQPSLQNIQRAATKQESLEQEKTRRENRIQDLYDQLTDLWMKFDVPEAEMESFVLENRGSTLAVIEAYQCELVKMHELKAQHMTLFVQKTREAILSLWEQLHLSQWEREQSFPSYFVEAPQPEDDAEHASAMWATDELLAAHEQHINTLTDELKQKAPVLKLLQRYRDLCEEGRKLDESAADVSRLMGRGNRGDPGRLLREEKMRKRVKAQKPKLEEELQRSIPLWEEENGTLFTIDGTRYLDTLAGQLESTTVAGRKRSRTASTTSSVGTVGASQGGGSVLRAASTNIRSHPPVSGANKKARLGSEISMSVSSSSIASSATSRRAMGTPAPPGSAVRTSRMPTAPSTGMRTPKPHGRSAPPSSPSVSRLPKSTPMRSATAGSSSVLRPTVTQLQRGPSAPYRAAPAFRPRQSEMQRAGATAAATGPGRASKWGDMGIPRFPTPPIQPQLPMANTGEAAAARSASAGSSSAASDMTTLIHSSSSAPAMRRSRPSMHIERTLVQLKTAGPYAPPSFGDSDGAGQIRTVSAELRADREEEQSRRSAAAKSSNWQVLDEDEGEELLMDEDGADFVREHEEDYKHIRHASIKRAGPSTRATKAQAPQAVVPLVNELDEVDD